LIEEAKSTNSQVQGQKEFEIDEKFFVDFREEVINRRKISLEENIEYFKGSTIDFIRS
jgi:hypothetical protein